MKRELRLFFDYLVVQHEPQRAALSVKRYVSFFSKLDSSVNAKVDITIHRLFEIFDGSIRGWKKAISFLFKRGLLEQMSNEEYSRVLEEASQRRYVERAKGTWYEQILRTYWNDLVQQQRKNELKGYTQSALRPRPKTITVSVAAAKTFLESLHIRQADHLRQISQRDLDKFLAEKGGYRDAVRPFVTYLNTKIKLFKKIKVETVQRGIDKSIYIGFEKSQQLLSEWADAPPESSRDALILTLCLLYAQPPRRIVAIRLQDLVYEGKVLTISFGNYTLRLNDSTERLVQRYLHVRGDSKKLQSHRNDYLFPGLYAGAHLQSSTVCHVAGKENLGSRQLFASSLINMYLAGIRHPKVLVQSFGITLPPALKYFQLVNERLGDAVADRLGKESHVARLRSSL